MTQPDEYLPEGSVNYGSLADLAAKTTGEWEAELRLKETTRFGNVLNGLRGGVPTGMPTPEAFFRMIAEALGLGVVWDGLEAVVEGIGNFLKGAAQLIYDVIDAIIGAVEGIPIVGPVVGGLWDAITRLLGIGEDAGSTARNAMREVNRLKALNQAGPDGESYSDAASYAAAAHLPSPYVLYVSGSGAGSYGPNGGGMLVWKPSLASSRCNLYRNPNFHISSGKFGCFMVTGRLGDLGGARAFVGAVDASGNGVVAAAGAGSTGVGLAEVVAGVPQGTISAVSTSMRIGDTFELYIGGTVSGTEYPNLAYIYQDGILVWSSLNIETAHGITLASDLYLAVGGEAVGASSAQRVPPSIDSFTIFDSNFTA